MPFPTCLVLSEDGETLWMLSGQAAENLVSKHILFHCKANHCGVNSWVRVYHQSEKRPDVQPKELGWYIREAEKEEM